MGQKKKVKGDLFRTVKVPMPQLADEEFTKLLRLRRDAGWIWNSLVSYHQLLRRERLPWPSMQDLARQMTGQTAALGLALGTQSQNLLFDEFLGVVRTAQQNRTTGNASGGAAAARFPWRQREARDCHWDRRDARTIEGKALLLSLAKTSDDRNKSGLKRQPPLVIPLKTGIPKNCTAITVHYDVLDRAFYLLFKVKVAQVKETQASGAMGIDLGQIRHAACITEDGASLNIKGRGLRSIQQGHNRKKAFRSSRLARQVKGSRRRQKEIGRRRRESRRVRRQVSNFHHTTTRRIVDFAVAHKIAHIACGDVVGVRDKDSGKRQNQANSDWPIGVFMTLLTYKAQAFAIQTHLVDESYTTRTCPGCGVVKTSKVSGRVYQCSACGLEGHRDAVGAWNILAKWYVSTNGHRPAFRQDIVASATQKYHVPVGVKGVRRSPVPRKFQPFTCSAEQPRSGPTGFEARPRQTPAGRGPSPLRDSPESRED